MNRSNRPNISIRNKHIGIFSSTEILKNSPFSHNEEDGRIGPVPPHIDSFILLENGSYILLEDGGRIILE